MLVGFTAFLAVFYRRYRVLRRKLGEIHPVVKSLAAAATAQYVAQIFHMVHLMVYRFNGFGFVALEVLSEILFMLSQVVVTTLLLLIGYGYTLVESELFDPWKALVCILLGTGIQVLLSSVGKLREEHAQRFHEHEGGVGMALLVLDLAHGFAAFFAACACRSSRSQHNDN